MGSKTPASFLLLQLYNASPWVIVDPNIPPLSEAATGVCLTTTCGAPFGPHSGNAFFYGGAWEGSTGNGAASTVSQEMPTALLTNYAISFWLAQPAAGSKNSWTVTWDGILLDGADNQGVFGYTHFLVPTLSSLAGMDTVKFSFYDNSASGGLAGYELDDVSIIPVGVGTLSAPEPGSVVLFMTMLLGVAGLVGFLKKRLA